MWVHANGTELEMWGCRALCVCFCLTLTYDRALNKFKVAATGAVWELSADIMVMPASKVSCGCISCSHVSIIVVGRSVNQRK